MRILLVANTAWYLWNFKHELTRQLIASGIDVVVVCPQDDYVLRLELMGVRWVEWRLNRAGMNPVGELSAIRQLAAIYRAEQPELVHHFTIKSILYGSVAARHAGVRRVVHSVTGLGHMFVSPRLRAVLARPLLRRWYRWALASPNVRPMFQNQDDLACVASFVPNLPARTLLTRGSGVNLARFSPNHPSNDGLTKEKSRLRVLFAGRLIAEKGIYEFVNAAARCRTNGRNAEFVVCGDTDPGNPSRVPDELLETWKADGTIRWLGHVDRMEHELAQADVVVLPSYREGTPRVLLEAAAMAKPLIATDVPGCREVVVHGENGLLVPPKNETALAAGIERLLDDPLERQRMGQAGRSRMVNLFDERQVVNQTFDVYRDIAHAIPLVEREQVRVALPRGVFTFSLDFELAWGTRGRPRATQVPPFLDGTRHAIRGLLKLFEKYEVSATWAIVGALLLGSGNDRERHRYLSDKRFDDIPAGDASTHPHWYAEDIVEDLLNCRVRQELGCHTLTHLFVDASPVGRAAFRNDLELFLELFADRNLPRPTSFIFPKARMGHFDVLSEFGFSAFRGPENMWFESLPGERVRAAVRLLDARRAGAPVVDRPRLVDSTLWMIPSSQFYSPFLGVGKRVRVHDRVRKAITGLRTAARQGGIFHLWTHPFNLGVRTEELLSGLNAILAEASRLRESGRLEILPMDTIANRLGAARCWEFPDAAALQRVDAQAAVSASTLTIPSGALVE